MNEPNVPMYNTDMVHVWPLATILSCSLGAAFAEARLSMKRYAPAAAATTNGTQNSPAAAAPNAPITGGMRSCTELTPMLPPAAFRPSAAPCRDRG